VASARWILEYNLSQTANREIGVPRDSQEWLRPYRVESDLLLGRYREAEPRFHAEERSGLGPSFCGCLVIPMEQSGTFVLLLRVGAEVHHWPMGRTIEIVANNASASKERRTNRRATVARKLLICPSEPPFSEEVQPTSNVSRGGMYFVTASKHYYVGMRVSLIAGYTPNDPCNATSFGEIVRITKLEDGRFGVAVRVRLA
jgi:hypothetical protein